MFRLDNILERWAMAYKPLSHNPSAEARPEERSFFRISMIDGNSYFVRNFQTVHSPAMAYVTLVDAELEQQNHKVIDYRHVIFFMVRQAPGDLSRNLVTDDMAATEARFEGDELVQDLLAYLFALKTLAGGKTLDAEQQQVIEACGGPTGIKLDKMTRECLRGMQLELAHWNTLPLPNGQYNGWQIIGLTIEQLQPRNLCIVPSRYRGC